MKYKDITGKTYWFLTAVRYVGPSGSRGSVWIFRCVCGKEKAILSGNVTADSRKYPVKSCGCKRLGLLSVACKGKELGPRLSSVTLIGCRFGRLVILDREGKDRWNHYRYTCLCDCGNQTICIGGDLISGKKRSCGCLRSDVARERATDHGMAHTNFHNRWVYMRTRCKNSRTHSYHNYGGRGIRVCKRWNRFINFKNDMYTSYLEHVKIYGVKDTSLDRIDNDGNYEPINCRWATMKIQANNKARRSKL